MTDEILFDRRGAVGFVTLNRPKALNALTQAMIRAFDRQLAKWETDAGIACVVVRGAGERAFCAGGDVRVAWEEGKALKAAGRIPQKGDLTYDFFFEEYRLNRRIQRFPKPYVSLLDGVTMGGGVGVSAHGSVRVVTERTMLAMPETAIGLFPDVGATHLMPRLPGRTGLYLALTGGRLDHAGCSALGIATHAVAASALEEVEQALVGADWAGNDTSSVIKQCLSGTDTPPAGDIPTVVAERAAIDRCFSGDSVEAILEALRADGGAFAAETLDTLEKRSPTSLRLTFESQRRGAELDFDACMRMEFRLSQACMAGTDFYEGIRAVLVEKDHAPKWSPASLAKVPTDSVAPVFDRPPPAGDLTFDD